MNKIYFLIVLGVMWCFTYCTKKETKQERYEVEKPTPTMLSGKGEPDKLLGNVGDYYIDLLTANLYGAKTDKGWGASVSLKGENGRNGTNGYQILSGSASPESDMGEVGDVYLDTQSLKLYGPKTTTGWGEGVVMSRTITEPSVLPTDYRLEVKEGRTTLIKWLNSGVITLDLTSVPELNQVTHIEGGCFRECSTLKQITLPNKLVYVGDGTFRNTALSHITISENVTQIGYNAFDNCKQLTSVQLPQSLERIHDGAFSRSGITEISLPNKITSVPKQAFYACRKLKKVTLGNKVETIGKEAFESSTISEITLPNSLKSIQKSAFSYCSRLKEIDLGNNIESIGDYAFYGTGLVRLTLPSNIKQVGEGAFDNIESLEEVDIQAPINQIPPSMFRHCGKLTRVTFPTTITSIGREAFYVCKSLEEASLPDNVTDIGYEAFYICENLSKLRLPNSLVNLEVRAFAFCEKLTEIELPSNLKKIGYGCFSHTALTKVVLPEGINQIESKAFYSTPITSINIPTSLTIINNFLSKTDIETLTLHSGVTQISDGAFAECKNLVSITIEAENPPTISELDNTEYKLFEKTPKLQAIYVPVGSVNQYKTAPGWSRYASKIQAM